VSARIWQSALACARTADLRLRPSAFGVRPRLYAAEVARVAQELAGHVHTWLERAGSRIGH
jgi:hypothetical protein